MITRSLTVLYMSNQAKILGWIRMINVILRTTLIFPKKLTRTVTTLTQYSTEELG